MRIEAKGMRWVGGVAFAGLLAAFCMSDSPPAAARFRGIGVRMAPVRFMPRNARNFAGRFPVNRGRVLPRPRLPIRVVNRPERPVTFCGGGYYHYGACGGYRVTRAQPYTAGAQPVFERRGPGVANAGGGLATGDRRFVPDEVIVAFSANASPQAIRRVMRRYDLTELEAQNFTLIGTALVRLHVGGRRSVPSVVEALQNQRIVTSAQPNYLFALQQTIGTMTTTVKGDPAQYVLAKLQVERAQQIATGANVLVAVIDSEIDTRDPDLSGSVVNSFDALGGEDQAQLHGTEMAGAIASHGKLLGIAPGVELLAARAFDDRSNGTSFAIYKSLQWAADNGARIVNMSFAGPQDALLQRMLAAAAAKGIVLIAAAGNAGPSSPPLYPAADPSVIAVTATDDDDHLFKMTNRGPYIAVAAPGVDILALAPDDAVQLTTGTSIAAAHVTGIASLLLQHDPLLKPADIRGILVRTGMPLEILGPHAGFDPGLVNAYRALTSPVKSGGTEAAHEQANR
jgi:subtilisin family serine protease